MDHTWTGPGITHGRKWQLSGTGDDIREQPVSTMPLNSRAESDTAVYGQKLCVG